MYRNAVQKSWDKLFYKEIICIGIVLIADALCFGRYKAGFAVKQNIAGDCKCPCAHFSCLFHRIVKQALAVALTLEGRRNSYRSEGHYRYAPSVITFYL